MLKRLLIISIIIINMLYVYSQARMLNAKQYLIAIGYENGFFAGTQNIASDNLETLFFNEYFDGPDIYITDPIMNKMISDELPLNKEGALRLCSFMLFRIAEKQERKERNNSILKIIIKTLKTDFERVFWYDNYPDKPIIITEKEITDYYSEAIKNKINSIPVSYLTPDEEKSARELLHTYCIKPEKENIAKLRLLTKHLADKNLKKAYGIMTLVKELSEDIFNLIYE